MMWLEGVSCVIRNFDAASRRQQPAKVQLSIFNLCIDWKLNAANDKECKSSFEYQNAKQIIAERWLSLVKWALLGQMGSHWSNGLSLIKL